MTKISAPTRTECIVYITLPGKLESVVAGRFHVEHCDGAPFGRFVYDRAYLDRADAVAVDPVELGLSSQVYETTEINGVFRAFRDARPDNWGKRIIERRMGKADLQEIDYLIETPDDRAGALNFGRGPCPPVPLQDFNQTAALDKLSATALAFAREEDLPANIATIGSKELLPIATSMGGARPKTVVEDANGLWVAKFDHPDDRWNNARVEHAMLNLGRSCGLMVAESKLAQITGSDVLLVKRFDREKTDHGYLRARMISGTTLLRAEIRHQRRDRWSYLLLAEQLLRVCAQPKRDAVELFRRMCFNALISNTDDHPRNHAFIAKNGDWELSPAYDLVPAILDSAVRRKLALVCGDWGRQANAENLLSQCGCFQLSYAEAASIVTEMEERVGNSWYHVARNAGVDEADCGRIAGSFAHPGFRLSPSES